MDVLTESPAAKSVVGREVQDHGEQHLPVAENPGGTQLTSRDQGRRDSRRDGAFEFSRTSVSVSAIYEDERTRWNIYDDGGDLLHIELYEVRYVGPPFDRDMDRRVLSLMLTREQLRELGKVIREVA